jgi:HEAT repeat protein
MVDAGIEIPSNVLALLDSVARGASASSWRTDEAGAGFQDIQARAMDLGLRAHEARPKVGADGLHVPWRESSSIQEFLGSMAPEADLAWSLSEEEVRRHSESMLRAVYALWPSGFTSAAVGTRLVQRYFDHLQLGEFFEALELIEDLHRNENPEQLGEVAAGAGVDAILDAVSLWGKEHWRDVAEIVARVGERMVPALLDRLQAEEALSRRKRLMEMIIAVGPRAAPAIAEVAQDPRWFVVRNAMLLLRRLNARDSVELVAAGAEHKDPRVVAEAVRTLAAFGDPRWLQGLARLLGAGVEGQREAVAVARRLRSPQIGALLATRIAAMKAGDLRLEENLELIEVAGLHGGAEVSAELLRLAGLSQWKVPFRLTEAWSAVARAAARMPDGQGVEVLRRIAEMRDPAADVARQALARGQGGDRGV